MFLLKNNVKHFSSMKFVYVAVLLIVAETTFLLYPENDLLYCLQMWQHQFSQAGKATSKISSLEHCFFNSL